MQQLKRQQLTNRLEEMKSENKLASIGLLTAISASLCCITPILALLAGTSGFASNFSWIEPFRPYLIGTTIVVLGFAWYQKIKPHKQIDCNCETTEKQKFLHTNLFLGLVTCFTILMLIIPDYLSIFYPETEFKTEITNVTSTQETEFMIRGMTCESCERHIDSELRKLPGIIKLETSYKQGKTKVIFDNSKTDVGNIAKTINSIGYQVMSNH